MLSKHEPAVLCSQKRKPCPSPHQHFRDTEDSTLSPLHVTVSHTSSKGNLNLLLTSRFHTVILTYLCFSSSDLVHSSFCPLYFRKVTFNRLFSEQKRCGFFILSVIQTWWKSTYALLDFLETVYCIHASLVLCLQYNGTAAYFFIITPFVPDCHCPESSNPVNSTKIARISTWARHCASCGVIRHAICLLSTNGGYICLHHGVLFLPPHLGNVTA